MTYKRKTFKKSVLFDVNYRDELKDELSKRDRTKYEFEGDLIFHAVMEFGQSVNITSPYYLNGICKEKCLIKSGKHYLCARGGSFKGEKNKVKVPYVFRDGGRPLSIEVVKEICKGCYNYGKKVLEDDKEFDKIITRNIRAICFKRQLIKEDYGFVCNRGGPSNDILSGVLEIRGVPYIFKIGDNKMPLDVVIRICNSSCIYSGMYML